MPDDVTPANPTQAPTYAAAPEAVSPEQSGEATGGGWFDALTGRGPADAASTFDEDGAEPTEAEASRGASGAQGSADDVDAAAPEPPPPPRKTEPGPDDIVRLTRTQYERKVQSEVDRLLARQARDAQKRAQQEAARAQKQNLLAKAEQDPIGFSDDFLTHQRQNEQLESQIAPIHRAIADAVTQYDGAIVNPVMAALPPEVAQKIVQQIQPVGVEGRGKLVLAALGELRKAERLAGREEGAKSAEAKLRRNAAFRKELLAELRSSEDEPELLPGSGRSPQPTDMDDWIRSAANARLS